MIESKMDQIECGTYAECFFCGSEDCCMCNKSPCTGCIFDNVSWENTDNGLKGLPEPKIRHHSELK